MNVERNRKLLEALKATAAGFEVVKPLKYGGRIYQPGEAIELNGKHDAILIEHGWVAPVVAMKRGRKAHGTNAD